MLRYSSLSPYMVAAGVLLVLALLRSWRAYDRNVDWSLAFLLSCLAAAIAGAVDLGTDVSHYRAYYALLAGSTDGLIWWEPGFQLLATVFASVGAPYGLLTFTCVLASHLIKLHVFDSITPNRMLAFFVLFCLNLGEIAFVRQYLAASLVLLGFYFLMRNQSSWALLWMVASVFVHKAALVPIAIVWLMHFKWSLFKHVGLFALGVGAIVLLLPADAWQGLELRFYEQVAAYTVEGFVQGLGAPDLTLYRNVVKFLFYVLLAGWMLLVPANSSSDLVQRKCAHIVVALSVVSVALILLISPVFARLGAYVFPFLALSMRDERFQLTRSELSGQYLLASMLLANLVIAMYPYVEFL